MKPQTARRRSFVAVLSALLFAGVWLGGETACGRRHEASLPGEDLLSSVVAQGARYGSITSQLTDAIEQAVPLWPLVTERLYRNTGDLCKQKALLRLWAMFAVSGQWDVDARDALDPVVKEALSSQDPEVVSSCIAILTRGQRAAGPQDLFVDRLETSRDTRIVYDIVRQGLTAKSCGQSLPGLLRPSAKAGGADQSFWESRARAILTGLRDKPLWGVEWPEPIRERIAMAALAAAAQEGKLTLLAVEVLLWPCGHPVRQCFRGEVPTALCELLGKASDEADRFALAAARLALEPDSPDARSYCARAVLLDVERYQVEDRVWPRLWFQAYWLGAAAARSSQSGIVEETWQAWRGLKVRDRANLLSVVADRFSRHGYPNPNVDAFIAFLGALPSEEANLLLDLPGTGLRADLLNLLPLIPSSAPPCEAKQRVRRLLQNTE